MVLVGDEGPNSPFNTSIDLDDQLNGSVGFVQAEGNAIVWCHGYTISINERRPDVEVLVSLVYRWNGSVVGDLQVVVGGVDVHFLVVNADSGIRVSRVDGDLNAGGDDAGGRDVEAEYDGVLEGKMRFFGLENGPN
ncbi:Hypothetical predicted protein [Olea europaea subsp. europaea]|uniref:Uncharacterized protein n=1 Tax=Olea europaea subsp. europaea TaxID=158383 RepID=A0A8S0UNM0_OLEEU|nr:Hypothetical predicted protein [Olea europaea subsp. europaea]